MDHFSEGRKISILTPKYPKIAPRKIDQRPILVGTLCKFWPILTTNAQNWTCPNFEHFWPKLAKTYIEFQPKLAFSLFWKTSRYPSKCPNLAKIESNSPKIAQICSVLRGQDLNLPDINLFCRRLAKSASFLLARRVPLGAHRGWQKLPIPESRSKMTQALSKSNSF